MTPTIITFATPNYLPHLDRLQKSIRKDMELEWVELPAMPWVQAVSFKPAFMRQELRSHPTGLLWTDADSVMMRPPDWDDLRDCDMAFRFKGGEVLTGTFFCANNPNVLRFLEDWTQHTRLMKDNFTPEQASLLCTLRDWPTLRVEHLSADWCWIFDEYRPENVFPIFEHYQASRELRHS